MYVQTYVRMYARVYVCVQACSIHAACNQFQGVLAKSSRGNELSSHCIINEEI